MYKLASIITPCYNGERYLDKYFSSILAQSYPSIELIFINDGSTDNTEKIALEYGERLKARGYQFIYLFQKNSGQSAAINQGLKLFSGAYLNWTDADNYLTDDSVEKRVRFLEENPDVGLVIGRSVLVDEHYEQVGIIRETGMERTGIQDLVEDFLRGDISCTSVCSTMVRTTMFRDAMPDNLQIEAPREIGQNYQLFLPIMFKYPTRYVTTVFGYYIVHDDSHSRLTKSFVQKMHILDVAYDTLNSISEHIKTDDEERAWFKNKIAEYDGKMRLNVLQHHRRKDGLSDIIVKLKRLGCYDAAARKTVLKIKYPFIKRLADRRWSEKNG